MIVYAAYICEVAQNFPSIDKINLQNVCERLLIQPQEPAKFANTNTVWLWNVA